MNNPTGNVVTLPNVRRESSVTETPFSNVYEMTQYVQGEIRSSKMKYKDIAKRALCNPQTVGRIADGTTKDPRVGTVIRILFALGRTLYVR